MLANAAERRDAKMQAQNRMWECRDEFTELADEFFGASDIDTRLYQVAANAHRRLQDARREFESL